MRELESQVSNKSFLINESQATKFWQRLHAAVSRIPKTWISIWVLAIPLLLLLPSLKSFPYPASGSQYSDLVISHYPNAVFLKEAITNWQDIPLWSPTILSGYPFAANPLSGLWYPLGWLMLLLPLPLGFNILVGLHLIWGGLGMYKLMNEEGLGHAAALFAGLAFALLPKFFAHYGAGHLTLLYAVPWTPWLLWSQRTEHKRRDKSFRDILILADDFFMKKGNVFKTMRRMAERLESESIPYAVIGGMALAAHSYVRMTLDVVFLLTSDGLALFKEKLLGRGYVLDFPGAEKSFRDTDTNVKIEVITTGEFPGDGLPKPVAFPDPEDQTIEEDNVRVITLEKLIELKLASGLSASHRMRDLADVQDLIVALNLPLNLMDKLDKSVRSGYKRIWKAAKKDTHR